MLAATVPGRCGADDAHYNEHVAGAFTLGDVIRKARIDRRWNQARLGVEAAKFKLREDDVAINKSTVSKVEKAPYTSEFGTIWRLLAALNLKFADVENRVGHPFIERHAGEGTPTKRRLITG